MGIAHTMCDWVTVIVCVCLCFHRIERGIYVICFYLLAPYGLGGFRREAMALCALLQYSCVKMNGYHRPFVVSIIFWFSSAAKAVQEEPRTATFVHCFVLYLFLTHRKTLCQTRIRRENKERIREKTNTRNTRNYRGWKKWLTDFWHVDNGASKRILESKHQQNWLCIRRHRRLVLCFPFSNTWSAGVRCWPSEIDSRLLRMQAVMYTAAAVNDKEIYFSYSVIVDGIRIVE